MAFCAGSAAAQDQAVSYPSRPVRVIVAGAPGGNPDILARLLSQRLTEEFGKPFVVETIPGSNGVLAARMIASASPDGYTLILGESAMTAINPALFSDLSYHPLIDFAPITGLAAVPTVLVVPPSLGVKTLNEFIALAKSKPGVLNYGSGGPGSIHHLTMAVFAKRAGIEISHVPYRGGTALVNGLLTGEIQAGWSGIPPVQSLIESGRLQPLAISTARRSKTLPDIATAAELGFPGFDYPTTIGLLTTAGTSPAIIARLQAGAARAMRNPAVVERMIALGMEEREKGTAEYTAFLKLDADRFQAIVRDLGLQIK
jgi:tripartite-type tricarboxylate transporter receptor subunit TctC